MTDLQTAHEQLVASPQLLNSWQKSRHREYAYAWHLLNHSWLIPPEIPRELIPHNSRVRIWEDGPGGLGSQSVTLTVFVGLQAQCRCRQALWNMEEAQQLRHRLDEFVNRHGEVPFVEPTFSIRDADVPYDPFRDHLEAIAACQVSAVTWQNPDEGSVTTNSGLRGFAYFSPSQPPARLQFEWSTMNDHPQSWNPVIERVQQLQAFLLSCFH